MGSDKDDARRDFLSEHAEQINIRKLSTKELVEERTCQGVTAYDVPPGGLWSITIHSSRRILNHSTLVEDSADAGPATFLKINSTTKNARLPVKQSIARAIDEELYLPLKAEVERTPYTSRLGFLKERLKQQIEKILDEEDK